jgi:hypothetical protein
MLGHDNAMAQAWSGNGKTCAVIAVMLGPNQDEEIQHVRETT